MVRQFAQAVAQFPNDLTVCVSAVKTTAYRTIFLIKIPFVRGFGSERNLGLRYRRAWTCRTVYSAHQGQFGNQRCNSSETSYNYPYRIFLSLILERRGSIYTNEKDLCMGYITNNIQIYGKLSETLSGCVH